MPPINFRDFAADIKSKFPVYKDADDLELSKAWLDKYPVYKDQVSFDAPAPAPAPAAPAQQTPQGDYIDLLAKHQANVNAEPATSWFERFAQSIPQQAYDVAVPLVKGGLRMAPAIAGSFAGPGGAFVGGSLGELGAQGFEMGLGEREAPNFGTALAEGGLNVATGGIARAIKPGMTISKVLRPDTLLGKVGINAAENAAFGRIGADVRSMTEHNQLASPEEANTSTVLGGALGAAGGAVEHALTSQASKLAKIKTENDLLEQEALKLDEAYAASQRGSLSNKPVAERPYEAPAPEPQVGAALPPERQLPARVPEQPGVEKGIALREDVLRDIEDQPISKWLENHMGLDKKTADWVNRASETIDARKAAEAAEAAKPPRETFASERGSVRLSPENEERFQKFSKNFIDPFKGKNNNQGYAVGYLEDIPNGNPGLETKSLPGDYKDITYRDNRGRPIATASIVKNVSDGQYYVNTLVADPDAGLAAGRAVREVVGEIEKHNPVGADKAMSEQAQRFLFNYLEKKHPGTVDINASQDPSGRFVKFSLAQAEKQPSRRLLGHGGVGGEGASVEELNRPGNFYKVGRGSTTFLGKQVDASLKPGEAIMQLMPDGSVKTYATEGLNFKQAESMYGPRVKQAAGGERGSITLTPKQREARRGQDYPLTPEMEKIDKGMGPEPPANLPAGIRTAAKVGSAYDKLIEQMTDRTIMTKRYQDIAQAEYGLELPQAARAREEALRWPGRMGKVEEELQEHVAPSLKKLDGVEFDSLKRVIAAEDAITKANATGNQNRVYSGGLTWQEAQQALLDMEDNLGPQRWKKVQDAANAVFDYNKVLLKKDLDSGNISQELYNDLLQKYPKYNRVRILDYIKGNEEGFVGGAREFFRNSDSGIRKLTEKGTSRRMMDPLESMVMSAFETENRTAKNDIGNAIVNWKQLSPTMDELIQKVGADHRFTAGEAKLQVRRGGVQETYSVPKEMEGIFKYGETNGELAAYGKWMGKTALEAGAVRRNPVFLAVNSMTDAATAMIRGLNPKDLAKGYYSAFTDDQWAKMARREGATMGTGFYSRDAKNIVSELSSRGVFDVRDKQDLKRLGDFLALGFVSHVGEKIENAPRIAAFRKEMEKSGDKLKAAIAGRDITVDFSKGGALAKKLNQLIPFFNIGVQGSLVIPRNIKDKRLWAGLGGVAATAAGFEVWNRKFSSYKDVPEQDTDNGLVLMLGEKKGKEGETVPVYAKFNLREFAAPVIAVRQAFDKAYGEPGRSWTDFAAAVAGTALPLKGEGAAGKVAQLVPPVPKAIMEVGTNKKFFRGRDINPPGEMAINTPEDRFGPYQTGIAKWLSKHGGKYAGMSPRDIESVVGTTLGSGGTRALQEFDNAKNLIPFKGKVESVSDVPLVGSLASGFYKERGGELKAKTYQAFGKDATKVTRDIFSQIDSDPTYQALDLKKKQKLQRQISNRADKMIKYKLKLLDKDKMEDYDGPMNPDELLAVTKELLGEINDD